MKIIHHRNTPRTPSGFTIVELLIVIIVIAVLASVTVVAYNGIRTRAFDSQSTSDMLQIQKSLENYYSINGSYPMPADLYGSNMASALGVSEKLLSSPWQPGTGLRVCNATEGLRLYCYVADGPAGWQCGGTDICVGYSLSYYSSTSPSADKSVRLYNKQGRIK